MIGSAPEAETTNRLAGSLRRIIYGAGTHQADCCSSNFSKFFGGVSPQRFLSDPTFDSCQELRRDWMIEEGMGLMRFGLQAANVRGAAIILDN